MSKCIQGLHLDLVGDMSSGSPPVPCSRGPVSLPEDGEHQALTGEGGQGKSRLDVQQHDSRSKDVQAYSETIGVIYTTYF